MLENHMELGDLNFFININELGIQVFDIQAEKLFIVRQYLCTSCGYKLLVTRCHGHELHVNLSSKLKIQLTKFYC